MFNVNSLIVPAIKHRPSPCRRNPTAEDTPPSLPAFPLHVFLCSCQMVVPSVIIVNHTIPFRQSNIKTNEVFGYHNAVSASPKFPVTKERVVVVACKCLREQQIIIHMFNELGRDLSGRNTQFGLCSCCSFLLALVHVVGRVTTGQTWLQILRRRV